MNTPTTIAASKLSIWRPYGRHGTAPRTMPNEFTTWEAETEKLRAMPGDRVFLSEPFGADEKEYPKDKDMPYRFSEFLTWWSGHRNIAGPELQEMLIELSKAGKTPVVYVGCPRYDIDEQLLALFFAWLPDCCYVAFDGAAGQEAGSLCHRVCEQYGGRDRFWIEAHPRAEMEHWHGYRLVYYASERVNVERDNAEGRPHTPDDAHPDIVLAWTGHHDRYGIRVTGGQIKRWASQGFGIACPAERQGRLKKIVEVSK